MSQNLQTTLGGVVAEHPPPPQSSPIYGSASQSRLQDDGNDEQEEEIDMAPAFNVLTTEEQKDCVEIAKLWVKAFINAAPTKHAYKTIIWGTYQGTLAPRHRIPITTLSRIINNHVEVLLKMQSMADESAKQALETTSTPKRKAKASRTMITSMSSDAPTSATSHSFGRRHFFLHCTFTPPKEEFMLTTEGQKLKNFLKCDIVSITDEKLKDFGTSFKNERHTRQNIPRPRTVNAPFPQVRVEEHDTFIRVILTFPGIVREGVNMQIKGQSLVITVTPLALIQELTTHAKVSTDDLILRQFSREVFLPCEVNKKQKNTKVENGYGVFDFEKDVSNYEQKTVGPLGALNNPLLATPTHHHHPSPHQQQQQQQPHPMQIPLPTPQQMQMASQHQLPPQYHPQQHPNILAPPILHMPVGGQQPMQIAQIPPGYTISSMGQMPPQMGQPIPQGIQQLAPPTAQQLQQQQQMYAVQLASQQPPLPQSQQIANMVQLPQITPQGTQLAQVQQIPPQVSQAPTIMQPQQVHPLPPQQGQSIQVVQTQQVQIQQGQRVPTQNQQGQTR